MQLSNCCEAKVFGAVDYLGICAKCHEPCELICEHEWEDQDDSFDHAFGTKQITPYQRCLLCNKTQNMPERDPDYEYDCAHDLDLSHD